MPKITFLKTQQSFDLPQGTELRDLPLYYPQAPLRFGCRQGDCGTCRITLTEGHQNLTPQTKREKLTLTDAPTSRLACQCALLGDIILKE